jgi:preprotein translocase subunit SecA
MVVTADQMVQGDLAYAIVDEVDNILIDEARTPLIISGQAEQATDRYYQFAQIARQLRQGRDYEVDVKHRTVNLSEAGIDRVEDLAGVPAGESIFDERYVEMTHHLEQAMKAHAIYHRDKDYIVSPEGEIVIVDEFTGRMMPGRRWSDGLHQAVEAKEGVRVRRQNVTMATITFQNYFRMYEKLAGMTGTAKTEAEEFLRIYNLDVVAVPTHRPMIRDDAADLVFKTEDGKFNAVVAEIEEMRELGRPVLVGTTSVEKSERLAGMLQRRGIEHEVLNAKQHEREAAIVALAGQAGAVTIATNMAGRGTDIVLGPGVKEQGGLHIVGTERHESRRIDNQLRGRAGRQGDPGSSRFYVSLEDELMRRFGSERISGIMGRLGMDDANPIEHGLISKSIESAQTKVEGHNFDVRKHVVQYDDVMNRHRQVIYEDRRHIVAGDDMSEKVAELIGAEIDKVVDNHLPERPSKDAPPDYEGLVAAYKNLIPNAKVGIKDVEGRDREEILEILEEDAGAAYAEVEARFEAQNVDMRMVERRIMLAVIDKLWVEHLTAMDELREGVGLQAYGQRDPLVVYKTEGFRMFGLLQDNIQHDVVHTIFRVQPAVAQQPVRTRLSDTASQVTNRDESAGPNAPRRAAKTPGRNDPCWCGSGKKFKFCHGAVASKTPV